MSGRIFTTEMQILWTLVVVVFILDCVLAQAQQGGSGRRRHHNTTLDDRALGAFLQRVSVGRALPCQTDADCAKKGNSKCLADNVLLCGRENVAKIFKAADDKVCTVDADCKSLPGSKRMTYRCTAGKCDFCSPRLCQTDADCCQPSTAPSGQINPGQKCAQITGFTEKRCWKACSHNKDCHVAHGSGKGKMECSITDGVCQKRSRRAQSVKP